MQAYLIDPERQVVDVVEWDGSLNHLYTLIGCDYVDVAEPLGRGASLYIDDEGLFKPDPQFFRVTGGYQPYAGKAVVLGTDDEGESTPPTQTIEWVRSNIRWGMVGE